jgi:hypothetical protein
MIAAVSRLTIAPCRVMAALTYKLTQFVIEFPPIMLIYINYTSAAGSPSPVFNQSNRAHQIKNDSTAPTDVVSTAL